MIATINIGEAASNLAHIELKRKYTELNKSKTDEEIDDILLNVTEEEVKYKPDVQEEFNELYGRYEGLLLSSRCDD